MKNILKPLLILYVAIFYHQCAHSQVITTVAGNGSGMFAGDGGPATSASINISWGVAIDSAGNIYIGDGDNERIRKINTSGIINTIAGNGLVGYSGDGGSAISAMLSFPSGVEADTFGNIYISDANNHRIRKVTNTGIITTIAGTGVSGFSGDGGPATAAQIVFSDGICADQYGNVFIPDPGNHRIRKISTTGIITTYAGTGIAGSTGDGGMATAARVDWPSDMDIDLAGNLYFTDYSRNVARKITPTGIISTIAGTGVGGFSGDGGPATAGRLNGPVGIDIDECGNIYIGDRTNNRVRMVTNAGIITTIAGTGTAGYTGDGGPATAARLNYPHAVCRDKGYVYIIDRGNYRLRRVKMSNSIPYFTGGLADTVTGCAGTAIPLNTAITAYDSNSYQRISWTLLSAPVHGAVSGLPYTSASTGGSIAPSGVSYTATAGYSGIDSFTIIVSDCFSSDTITIYADLANATGSIGAVTGPSSVCVGATISLADTSSGGTWTVSNGNATISSSGVVTGVTAGQDTVYYSIITGCGSLIASYVITITGPPALPTISGPTSVCPGGSITLTASPTGGSWSATNPTASVSAGVVTGISPGTDTINYSLSNSCGTTTSVHIASVSPFLTIVVPSITICTGTFGTLTASGATTYTWSPSSTLSASTGSTVSANPVTTTVYTINGVSAGCTGTTTATVTVAPPPPPPAVVSPVVYCYGATASPLSATGSSPLWYTTASGGVGTATAPAVSTTTPGTSTYWVSQSIGSCESSRAPVTVTIYPQIDAAFSTSISYGCTFDTVRLLNSSVGAITWLWTMSDGTTSTAPNPTHYFATQHTYTVQITIHNGPCSDSAGQVLDLHHADSAAFSLPLYACTGSSIALTNLSATAAPSSYNWLFGDGGNSTAPSPTHTYTAAGTYSVTLIAANFIPCYDTVVKVITVDSPGSAAITLASPVVCSNHPLAADLSVSGAGFTDASWDMGDGNTFTGGNHIVYDYSTTGIYIISVLAHFRACPDATASQTVNVISHPYVNLGPDIGICELGNVAIITDKTNESNPLAQWQWNTGVTTSSIYVETPGRYEVIVSIGDCSASDDIEVYNDCSTDFPNVFSPNGDGLNDIFDPRDFLSKELLYYNFSIYNRWGEVVYTTDKTIGKGWDGTFRGDAQPQGVFTYTLKAKFFNGQLLNKNGNLTLIR